VGSAAPGVTAGPLTAAPDWDDERWATVLNRMEHRQAGVGLRFWGPPLWLEVTMTGPDSDTWATATVDGGADRSWDWQAEQACEQAAVAVAAGADDDALLDVASRYTLENLVLNATHEVGEWLRFDTRRIFSAHLVATGTEALLLGPGRQGNGAVAVEVEFAPTAPSPPAATSGPGAGAAVAARAASSVGAWRYTFLPGTGISLGPAGPAVTGNWSWATAWSEDTITCLGGPDEAFVAAVHADVHRMLIRAEAARICDAFHVDGRARWYLRPDDDPERASRLASGMATTADRSPVDVKVRIVS
jgi:hypothetical protein